MLDFASLLVGCAMEGVCNLKVRPPPPPPPSSDVCLDDGWGRGWKAMRVEVNKHHSLRVS